MPKFPALKSRRAIGIPIGNAILIAALHSNVPRLAPLISADAAVANGPLNLTALTMSRTILAGLREAWALAVSRVNLFLLIMICVSVPTACGMQWLNIKEISQAREQQKRQAAIVPDAGKAQDVDEKRSSLQGEGWDRDVPA